MGGALPAALLAFPEYCRTAGRAAALAMVQNSRAREQRLVYQYRGADLRRGGGVEIDYAERGRHGGERLAPGSRRFTAAGQPQGTPTIPVLRDLLPALPLPPPPPEHVAPQQVPGHEPRYFPTCAACHEEAEQGQEWTWFGARRGCGHGMHPPCWGRYVTHCAMNARRSPRTGHMHGQIHISCPTCRSDVSGEVEIVAGTGPPLGRELFERVVVPGSEPNDLPTFVPRAPRIAFPEHVNRDDGRPHAVAHGAGFRADERGHGSDATSSTGSAPAAHLWRLLPWRTAISRTGFCLIRRLI